MGRQFILTLALSQGKVAVGKPIIPKTGEILCRGWLLEDDNSAYLAGLYTFLTHTKVSLTGSRLTSIILNLNP